MNNCADVAALMTRVHIASAAAVLMHSARSHLSVWAETESHMARLLIEQPRHDRRQGRLGKPWGAARKQGKRCQCFERSKH